jgi:hypothetical protein
MNDIEKYGSGGENVFISLEGKSAEDKGYRIFDVTKEVEYQYTDIDFIICKDKTIEKLPSIDEVLSNDVFEKVEVKVDTRALETGNLPYEFISHGSSGWSVITKAKYIYMILCDESGNNVTAKTTMWIDMHKWHRFVQDRRIAKRINFIKDESIVDLLCRISDMRANKVILSEKKVNIQL